MFGILMVCRVARAYLGFDQSLSAQRGLKPKLFQVRKALCVRASSGLGFRSLGVQVLQQCMPGPTAMHAKGFAQHFLQRQSGLEKFPWVLQALGSAPHGSPTSVAALCDPRYTQQLVLEILVLLLGSLV